MATPQHPAGTAPQGRPNAQGMSQGTYTGNVGFSRGTTDLVSRGASLPSTKAAAPTPAPTPVAQPVAPPPSRPRFLGSVSF